jgi:hypothetical protein
MSPQVFRSSPFILALLLALLSTQPVAAAELTLQECITRALDKNFQLQIQSFETANANESLSASQSSYDPSFTLSASKSASQADQPSTSLVGTKNDNFNTRVSVSQKITTGATVNVSSTLIRNETNNSFATLNPAYNADVTLSIKQPLLKNAGSAVNKAAIRRAEIGVTIAEQNYKSNVLQLVRDTEVAYFSLVFAREQLKVRSLSLELAEKLYEENRTKKDTGVATDLDVLQSEVGVATARRAVLLASSRFVILRTTYSISSVNLSSMPRWARSVSPLPSNYSLISNVLTPSLALIILITMLLKAPSSNWKSPRPLPDAIAYLLSISAVPSATTPETATRAMPSIAYPMVTAMLGRWISPSISPGACAPRKHSIKRLSTICSAKKCASARSIKI